MLDQVALPQRKPRETDAGGAQRSLGRRRRWAYLRARGFELSRAVASPFVSLLSHGETISRPAGHLLWQFVMVLAAAGRCCVHAAAGVADAAGEARLRLIMALPAMKKRSHVSRLNCTIVMLVLCAAIFGLSFYDTGLEVFLDGESIGYVSNQQEFLDALETVEGRVSDVLGHSYHLMPDVTYQIGVVNRNAIFDSNQVQSQLFSQVTEVQNLYVLSVDGEIIGATAERAPLQAVLDNLLDAGRTEQYDQVTFLRDVQINRQLVASSYLTAPSELAQYLGANVRERQIYTVQEGQTLSAIAAEHGLTSADLIALNPGISANQIKVGDEIVVRRALPYLSLQSSRRVVYTEDISFETETVKDDSMYTNQKKTLTDGQMGEAQITADLVFVDGEQTGHEIVSRVVLSQPVTKVVAVGTKTPPPKAPTGTFIRPYGGILTSNYGYRGREFHTGVDFAGPVGSTIKAADGGVVTFAGWKGTYGYFVIVDHGSGISTAYAHNSKLYVSVGQQVAKGEAIAALGSTGRSTGPHVHFEVRVNGKHVNPWNYIS